VRRIAATLGSIVVVAAAFAVTPAAAQDDADPVTTPVEEITSVIVELVDLAIPGDASVLAARLDVEHEGVETTAVLDELDLMAADVTPAGRRALERDAAVESVRPARHDLRLLLDESTVTIGASELHLEGVTGSGRVVAVIDSGVDVDHPGIVGSVVEQGCFLTGVPTFEEEPGVSVTELCKNGTRSDTSAEPCTVIPESCTHGTAVAGIITGDDVTFRGVAPDAGIIALRVTAVVEGLEQGGSEDPYSAYIPEAGVLEALEHVYSLRNTYDIAAVNLSLGGDPGNCEDSVWENVVVRLTDAGIAVVAATGNSGWENAITFPACLDDVIAVGASNKAGEVASFTNTSSDLDLLAPGSGVDSTVLTSYDASGFAPLDGTSFAAPHVAAAFALVGDRLPSGWSVARALNLLRVSGEMIERVTANPFDHDPRFPEVRLDSIIDFAPFVDASAGFWVLAADWAKITGVSTGISPNVFGPGLPLTRAQAVTFLWRLMGEPDFGKDSGFSDVDPSAWYAAAVAWAEFVGVTTGTAPGVFSPEEFVSRGQLATLMWRTAGEPAPSATASFIDVYAADYFARAVYWMAEHVITTGTTPTTYSPDDVVTRAQMVTFEFRLADADFAWTGSVEPPELALF
jgi:subtilisin family serine protease